METERLYSPLEFFLWDKEDAENGVYDDIDYRRDELSHEEAFGYMDAIELAMRRDRGRMDKAHGMAEYVPDSLDDIVVSMFPGVELHGDKLWCVADVALSRPITPSEMGELTQWWSGQLSDGWGEGISQREIPVGRGDLYMETWTPNDSFFIDTEREFRQRLGLKPLEAETPAQAALHEPDIYDGEAAAALREQLINRLNMNLGDYFNYLHGMNGKEIASFSSEIAVTADAHYYLTEMHNFHTSELEYLLKFQNPLEVVADAFDAAGVYDRSNIMWNIFDRQDALQGDYPLMPDPDVGDALKQELSTRLDKNLSNYHASMMALDKPDLIGKAGEIAAVNDAHFYLTEHHEFDASEAVYLLQFQNPLKVVADAWKRRTEDISDMSFTLDEVFGKQEALQGNYQLVTDEPSSPASKENTRDASAEKPSVLDRIREAAKAPKEPPKDKPAQDKSGPEL